MQVLVRAGACRTGGAKHADGLVGGRVLRLAAAERAVQLSCGAAATDCNGSTVRQEEIYFQQREAMLPPNEFTNAYK